jgi:hypothetical protein
LRLRFRHSRCWFYLPGRPLQLAMWRRGVNSGVWVSRRLIRPGHLAAILRWWASGGRPGCWSVISHVVARLSRPAGQTARGSRPVLRRDALGGLNCYLGGIIRLRWLGARLASR